MSDAINPLEREGCWLCDGCGEIESTGAIGARETVGCPVCVQNDTEWMMGEKLRKKQEEIDALAARYSALADEVRTMILDSDGLAGYHLNGEVACWSELEVGHLLAEPDEVGRAVLARLKSRWQEAAEGLAAHVERLKFWAYAVHSANNTSRVTGFDRLLEAVDASPATSLDRLKAQWQAEALEEFHNRAHTSGDFPGTYWDMRRELRRQAEGGE